VFRTSFSLSLLLVAGFFLFIFLYVPANNQQKIAGRSLSFLWSTPRLTLERKKER
jgi:hypothetical protein